MSTQSGIYFDDEVKKLLQQIAQEKGFNDFQIEGAPDSLEGNGYLSDTAPVRIIGKGKHNNEKVLHMVIKCASKDEAIRKARAIPPLYKREVCMYDFVIPALGKFQEEKILQPLVSLPKCYKTCLKSHSEVLILENLQNSGYREWNRKIPMDEEHVNFVMQAYGRFHALSYAMRSQNPEQFQKLAELLSDDIFGAFLQSTNIINAVFVKLCINAQNVLDPVEDKEALNIFKSWPDKIQPFFNKLPEFVDDHSVILHGDCWSGNMMFKYEDLHQPHKPTNMRFLDLQLSRLGSPVLDLSYFFYTCASKKIINNFEQYLEVYYTSLSQHLRRLGSNSDDLYTYSVFQQHWKKYAKYGFVFALLLINVMLIEEKESPNNGYKKSLIDFCVRKEGAYSQRIKPIILHFIRNGFI